MSRPDTVRELTTELSPSEKAQALQWLVRLLGHESGSKVQPNGFTSCRRHEKR